MKSLEGKSARWFGPVDEFSVAKAEESIGVPMPALYKSFLLQYGSGVIGQYEIYGLGCPQNGVPNLLWLIQDLKQIGLQRPTQIIPFHAEGDGDYSAVLAAPLAGQSVGSVVYWSPRRDDQLDIRPAAVSLEDWFANRVR